MSADLYLQLQWLPPPPANWRQRLKQLGEATDIGRELQFLASHALSVSQLQHLKGMLDQLRARGRSLAPLTSFRLGVVSNSTLDLLVPQLVASAARHGILLECVQGQYGQVMQEALDPASAINRAGCQAVLLALDYRDLLGNPYGEDGQAAIQAAQERLAAIRKAFLQNGGAPSIVQTLAPPPESLFGNFDRRLTGTLRSRVIRFNDALIQSLASGPDYLLDMGAMAETVGLAAWHAPAEWHLAKLPFSLRASPYYADQLARLLGAILGKSRRCLVLDLDNTLWGGIVGDDGLHGLRLGQGDPEGEAFIDVQHLAHGLHARGIILAISSKNDDAIARQAFRDHPDMILREEHIAVFQANWSDKAANLRAIAKTLSLGLSSLVFLDDNPAERTLVRQQLPEVAVPELPADPSLYPRTLAAAGYFEAISFSAEDGSRNAFYEANARRALLEESATDLGDYLASLRMEISFRPFDAIGRDRIVQLIAKSNQFNLTTRRYTAHEIAQLEADPRVRTIQVRLRDAFGDNGMISIVILRAETSLCWVIDSWLMSCRVLGRGVETMVLAEIIRMARSEGVEQIRGLYRPTSRNALVQDHYARLGFAAAGVDADGNRLWIRSTEPVDPLPPIAIAEGPALMAAGPAGG